MNYSNYIPYLIGLTGIFMIISAYAVTRLKDLVYASVALAFTGMFNAAIIALLGFPVVAAFVVAVYVGAAVMFIILSVSMIGTAEVEPREEFRGSFVATLFGMSIVASAIIVDLVKTYHKPGPHPLSVVSGVLLSKYMVVLGVLFVALAATLVEAISVARRGETE
jgi:NADH-quinone oxidoreductase subunit J